MQGKTNILHYSCLLDLCRISKDTKYPAIYNEYIINAGYNVQNEKKILRTTYFVTNFLLQIVYFVAFVVFCLNLYYKSSLNSALSSSINPFGRRKINDRVKLKYFYYWSAFYFKYLQEFPHAITFIYCKVLIFVQISIS